MSGEIEGTGRAHLTTERDLENPTRLFRIESEEQAFDLLEKSLRNPPADDLPFLIEFGDWVDLKIHLPNTPIDGSISPSMMSAFIDLQKEVYRTHSLLTANSGDLRFMTRIEKDRLEFRVKVSKGSSDYWTDLSKTLEAIAQSAVTKMSAAEVFFSVLAISIVVGGTVAWKAWLSSRIETRKLEVDGDDKRAWLELEKERMAQDTKRYTLLVEAIRRVPVLGDIEASLDAGKNALVQAVGEEKGGTIQGIEFSRDLASEVTSSKRQQSVPTTITAVYKVARVDTTMQDGFRVTLTNIATDEEISASLQDALVSDEHRHLIQAAEWNKLPIRVRLSARLLRNRPIDAVILSVETVASETPPS